MILQPVKHYYERAETWATDHQAALAASRRAAWIVASIAAAVALLEAVALILLTPLKTVVPMTLLVDRQTGFVQALNPLEPRRVGVDQALTQSFLVQYVIARETLDRVTLQSDYRKVGLWSTGKARSDYLSSMSAGTVNGALSRLKSGDTISVSVKSVSLISRDTALVRFATVTDQHGGADIVSAWVAVIRFRYSDAPMKLEDRFTNPLGFQVLSYRRDAETLPVAELAPRSAAASPAPSAAAPSGSVAIVMPARNVPLGSPLGAVAGPIRTGPLGQ